MFVVPPTIVFTAIRFESEITFGSLAGGFAEAVPKVAGPRGPAGAGGLVRICHPWSRRFLVEHDPAHLAWLDGEIQVFPGQAHDGGNPNY